MILLSHYSVSANTLGDKIGLRGEAGDKIVQTWIFTNTKQYMGTGHTHHSSHRPIMSKSVSISPRNYFCISDHVSHVRILHEIEILYSTKVRDCGSLLSKLNNIYLKTVKTADKGNFQSFKVQSLLFRFRRRQTFWVIISLFELFLVSSLLTFLLWMVGCTPHLTALFPRGWSDAGVSHCLTWLWLRYQLQPETTVMSWYRFNFYSSLLSAAC